MAAVEIAGLRRLLKMLDACGPEIAKTLSLANRLTADEVAARVRAVIPSGPSGRLRGSVKGQASRYRAAVSIGRGISYAKPVIFGTGPRPGLRGPHNIATLGYSEGMHKPAAPYRVADDMRGELMPAYSAAIENAINAAHAAAGSVDKEVV